MLDPLHGDGYQFWSGIGGAMVMPLVYSAAVWAWPTRCAQLGCFRRARAVTSAGVPFCRGHLPEQVPL